MPLLNRWGQQNSLIRRVRQHGALSTLFRTVAPSPATLGRVEPVRLVLGQLAPTSFPAAANPSAAQAIGSITVPPVDEISADEISAGYSGEQWAREPIADVSAPTLPTAPAVQRQTLAGGAAPLPAEPASTLPTPSPVSTAATPLRAPAPVLMPSASEPLSATGAPPGGVPMATPVAGVARTQRQPASPTESSQTLQPNVASAAVTAQPLPVQRQPMESGARPVMGVPPQGIAPTMIASRPQPVQRQPLMGVPQSVAGVPQQAIAPGPVTPQPQPVRHQPLVGASPQEVAPAIVAAQLTPLQPQPGISAAQPNVATPLPATTSTQVATAQSMPPSPPVQRQTVSDAPPAVSTPPSAPAPVAASASADSSGIDDTTWSRLQTALRKARAQVPGSSQSPATPPAAPLTSAQRSPQSTPAPQRPTDRHAPRRTMITEQPTSRSRTGDTDPSSAGFPNLPAPDLSSTVVQPAVDASSQLAADAPKTAAVAPSSAPQPAAPTEANPLPTNAPPIQRAVASPVASLQDAPTSPVVARLVTEQATDSAVAVASSHSQGAVVANIPPADQTLGQPPTVTPAPPVVAGAPDLAWEKSGSAASSLYPTADAAQEPFIEEDPALPLEAAWPVQRLVDPVAESKAARRRMADEPDPVAAAHPGEPPILADVVQQQLERAHTAQPTEAKIDVIKPRRPRPMPHPSVQRESASTTPDAPLPSPPTNPTATIAPGRPIEEELTATLIPTEFGDLPADLWRLVGAPAPAPAAQPVQQSSAPAEPMRPANVPAPIQSAPVVEPASPSQSRSAPLSTPAPSQGTVAGTPLQREQAIGISVPPPQPGLPINEAMATVDGGRAQAVAVTQADDADAAIVESQNEAAFVAHRAPATLPRAPQGVTPRLPPDRSVQRAATAPTPTATAPAEVPTEAPVVPLSAATVGQPADSPLPITQTAVAAPQPAIVQQPSPVARAPESGAVQSAATARSSSKWPASPAITTPFAAMAVEQTLHGVQRQDNGSAPALSPPAENRASVAAGPPTAPAIDTDALARQVYTELKRKLAIERERLR
ncbi:MAG: hypothetical protein R3C14_44685 [Caldilineaceae bacterium]